MVAAAPLACTVVGWPVLRSWTSMLARCRATPAGGGATGVAVPDFHTAVIPTLAASMPAGRESSTGWPLAGTFCPPGYGPGSKPWHIRRTRAGGFEHATNDVTMAERRRRTSHVAERRSKTTCGAVSRNCRMARSPVGACRSRPCAKLPLLPPSPQRLKKKRRHATEHAANHATITSGGASGAEGERSAQQRGATNGTAAF